RGFRCSRLSRRQVLQIGALGGLGVGLPALLRADDESRGTPRAPARSVIFLHQFGGASHHDTFDMKPNAPAAIRGEFRPIASSAPGTGVCERLPRMAQIAHLSALVRSVTHATPAHNSAAYYSLTGHKPQVDIVTANATATDFPAYGAIVDRLAPSAPRVPTAV